MTEASTLDTEGMFDLAAALPDHVEFGFRAAQGLEGLPDRERIENIVVLGMGDAAIAGDMLFATAAPFVPVPINVVRSYELPAYVSEGSLVFALSYSGNTEEIVEAATAAAVQGARMVVVSGGGQLSELAGSWGAPVVRVPKHVAEARAALGAYATPAIAVLEDIGLFPGAGQWVELAVEQLKKRRDELTSSGNAAEALARQLANKAVLVQGGGPLGLAAAQRWKAQLNQNAKTAAFWSNQPELCHNEVVGWDVTAPITKENLSIVCLRHDDEHPQVSRRFELANAHVESKVSAIHQVQAEGDGTFAQLWDLILFGDFVSLYLAREHGVDPGPVPFLSELKAELSDH